MDEPANLPMDEPANLSIDEPANYRPVNYTCEFIYKLVYALPTNLPAKQLFIPRGQSGDNGDNLAWSYYYGWAKFI
jgi:hypothetical protein